MQVLLTGATGFVGSHMAERLVTAGHRVVAPVRNIKPAARALSGLNATLAEAINSGQIALAEGDVVTGAGLEDAARGCDAAIHLVGIIMPTKSQSFDDVHTQGTRNVVAAAQHAAVRRFVQMSALGVRANGVSGYQTSKAAAEEIVRHSGIPFTILRPSIIFGPRDGFVTQMVDVMKSAPLVRPVPGNGKYPFRPVWIGNVVDCFVQSLTNAKAVGQSIDVVGPDELTLEQLLAQIAECIGVGKPAVKVPFQVMYLNAMVLGAIMEKPPVTTDQLRMLREGSTADPGPMLGTFNLQLVGFREGLKRYLCRE